jgi:hypothetical protein
VEGGGEIDFNPFNPFNPFKSFKSFYKSLWVARAAVGERLSGSEAMSRQPSRNDY